MKLHFLLAAALAMVGSVALADDATGPYKVVKTVTVGGDGGWDYVTVDPDNRHIFVSRGSRFDVFDADSLQKVGEIDDTPRCHGVAIDAGSGHGFTSNGGDPSVTMFDLKTLKPIKKITVTGRPDGIFYEPSTKHVFVESHSDPNETVINAADGAVVGTIDLGGAPEQGASDGNGHVYVNLEDKSAVAVVDPTAMKVTTTYTLGDGDGPSGMGLDAKNRRVFACCGNAKMVVLDADSGKILATLPTARGTDAGTFNPDTLEAFSSNGSGTLTVVKESDPNTFAVEQDVQTPMGARTCALDAKTGNIILVTAKFPQAPTSQPAGENGRPRGRRQPIPGSFMIVVVGKS